MWNEADQDKRTPGNGVVAASAIARATTQAQRVHMVGVCLQLKFFQLEGRFSLNSHEIPSEAIGCVAPQMK